MTAERQLRAELAKLKFVQPVDGLVYRGPADFVLREGRVYRPAALPAGVVQHPPRHCFANAIHLAIEHGFDYVEGFALSVFGQAVHHAWNARGARLVDATWRPMGLAYLGVVFGVERADDCTWNGDATVLDDYARGWPLLRQRWAGEDAAIAWPPSERLDAMRAHRDGDDAAMRALLKAARG